MSIHFPVSSFYPKQRSKRLLELEIKLERNVSEAKKKPLPPPLKSSLQGYPIDWKIFHKQDEALEYAKQRELGLMTFSFEEQVPGSNGRRKYVVTHPINMWKNHISRPIEQRCSYEVIPIGSPCKLYFDLEFNKLVNPMSDGNKMVDTLLRSCSWVLEDTYKLQMSKRDVLILDASTATKFSQHLICQNPLIFFQDNLHIGNFVKYLMMLVKDSNIPNVSVSDQQDLFVKNDKGELVSFCDLAVYTKNRNFRLFLASKFEKKVPLVLSKTNTYVPERIRYNVEDWPVDEAAFFSSSLITYFGTSQPKLQKEEQLLTFGSQQSNESNMKNSSNNTTHMDLARDPSLNGYKASPWIEIDRFIAGLVAPTGTVRQWVYFDKTETIVYQINGNRFCSSIGREHKRNNIKFVVNLPNATYYQSCFDPDCANSRQLPQPIPPEHLPWFTLLADSTPFDIAS